MLKIVSFVVQAYDIMLFESYHTMQMHLIINIPIENNIMHFPGRYLELYSNLY